MTAVAHRPPARSSHRWRPPAATPARRSGHAAHRAHDPRSAAATGAATAALAGRRIALAPARRCRGRDTVSALSPDAIQWDTEPAILVIVAGVTIAVAGLFGRAYAAVVIGFLVATVATVLIGSGLHLHGGVGDRVYRPGPGEPVASSYQLGVGQLRLDLRDATLPRTTPTRISADVGVGRLLVIVPDDVRLTVNADNRVGNVELDTKYSEGTDVQRSITVGPLTGRPVVLDADVGIGSLEVRRGDPPWPTRGGDTISGALPSSLSTWSNHDHA